MHPLDVMTEAQALQLLGSEGLEAALQAEPEAAQQLCKLCAYHPLALSLAARRLLRRLKDAPQPIAAFTAALKVRLRGLEINADPLESLRANFDLSYDALPAQSQKRYRALAVFSLAAGFSAAGAGAVWSMLEEVEMDGEEARQEIERLQDALLVFPLPDAPGRFGLHDLLREHAAEKLAAAGETEAAGGALAEYLLAEFDEHSLDDLDTASYLETEYDNLRLSAEWAMQRPDGKLLARLATVPRNWFYNIFRAWDDWLVWLKRALELELEDQRLKANVLKAIGDVQQFRDERDAALESYAQALALFRAVGAKLGEANVLAALSRVKVRQGKFAEAEQDLGQVITMRRAIRSLYDEGIDYGNFAIALLAINKPQEAQTYVLKAQDIFQHIGEPSLIQWVQRLLAACSRPPRHWGRSAMPAPLRRLSLCLRMITPKCAWLLQTRSKHWTGSPVTTELPPGIGLRYKSGKLARLWECLRTKRSSNNWATIAWMMPGPRPR